MSTTTLHIGTSDSIGGTTPSYYFSENEAVSTREPESTGTANPTIAKPAVIVPKPSPVPEGRFKLLQSWEGRVTGTHGHEFTAIITDRTNPNNPDEEVVIDKEEVSFDDHELIFPGAVFYWSIGYKDAPGEPRRRVSQIRFRRLPALSRRELEQAAFEARQLAELFGDD